MRLELRAGDLHLLYVEISLVVLEYLEGFHYSILFILFVLLAISVAIIGLVEDCGLLDKAIGLLEDRPMTCSLIDRQGSVGETTSHIVASRGRYHAVMIPIDDPDSLGDFGEILRGGLSPANDGTELST